MKAAASCIVNVSSDSHHTAQRSCHVRILIVEDEPKVAQLVREALTEAQFAADVAVDGVSALERVSAMAYDLLILDVMLPDMGGFGVCRQVRSLGLNTPVLMLSARSLVDDRVRGLDSGADDYLTKPLDVTELMARVRPASQTSGACAGASGGGRPQPRSGHPSRQAR